MQTDTFRIRERFDNTLCEFISHNVLTLGYSKKILIRIILMDNVEDTYFIRECLLIISCLILHLFCTIERNK